MGSFKQLYDSVFPIVLRVSYHITNDIGVSEDICQEAFIKYNERAALFPTPDQAKYWLIRVVKNMSLNYQKRKGRERKAYEKILRQPQKPELSGEETVLRKETAEIVKGALQDLPEKLRMPLVLKEYADLEYKEIAKILKISESNVKVRIFRARNKMAQLIDQEEIHVSK